MKRLQIAQIFLYLAFKHLFSKDPVKTLSATFDTIHAQEEKRREDLIKTIRWKQFCANEKVLMQDRIYTDSAGMQAFDDIITAYQEHERKNKDGGHV